MDINREKQKIFSKIASVKVDSSSLLSNKTNLFGSIDKPKSDITDFLIDLLKSLEDIKQIKEIIIDSIYRNSEDIEVKIKNTFKKSLNDIILCFSDPKVPNSYLMSSSGLGFETNINNIDFFKMLKNAPNTEAGKLLYFDSASGLNSKDFNVVLHQVTKQPNVWHNWKNILHIKFNNQQIISFKINNSYSGKKLSKFFWDFIEALDLFDTKILLNNLVDGFSGTIQSVKRKNKDQIKTDLVIDKMIDNLLKIDELTDDNEAEGYFSFTNEESVEIEDIVNSKSKGSFVIETAYESLESMITPESLNGVNNELDNNSPNEIDSIISNALNSLGTQSFTNSLVLNATDIPVVQLNFIESLVKNLSKMLSTTSISPKLVVPFLMANHMVGNPTPETPDKFIKDNLNIFKSITSSIKTLIVGLILDRCIKLLSEIVRRKMVSIMSERITNRSKQLRSLTGL